MRITTTLEIDNESMINSISHWLKYKTDFSVFERYEARYGKRIREILINHFLDYPHTRGKMVKETKNNAIEVFNSIF